MKRVLVMSATDNVANAIEDIGKGEGFEYSSDGKSGSLIAVDDIPFGFKASIRDIPSGGEIIKYKQVIGRASRHIRAGECVHIHNVEGTRGRGDQRKGADS
jgi:altronate dehydratase small subunit